jgi:hypothetical protein
MTIALALLPSAAGVIARLAVARALAAGIDPGPLLRRAGLEAARITDHDATIPVRG